MSVLEVRYDTNNIFLTIGIAAVGVFAAVSLCEQYRIATLSSSKERKYFILFLVACSLGFCCTWCMHAGSFSGMRLFLDDTEIPVRFNAAIMIIAAFQSVIQTFIGLYISSKDDCFNNSRAEIMEKFILRARSTYTMEEIRKMSKLRILFIVLTHSLGYLNVGGLFGGAGISLMHYLMVHSMKFQGTVEYNPGIVVASFLFSMFNGTGGFWAFFRLMSLYSTVDALRYVVTFLGITTVCGMHYIGMKAVTFRFDPDIRDVPPTDSISINQEALYRGVVCSSVMFATAMFVIVLHDLRAWLVRTSAQLKQADKAIAALLRDQRMQAVSPPTLNNPCAAEVLLYTNKYMYKREESRGVDNRTSFTTSATMSSRREFVPIHRSLYQDETEDIIDNYSIQNDTGAAESSRAGSLQQTVGIGGHGSRLDTLEEVSAHIRHQPSKPRTLSEDIEEGVERISRRIANSANELPPLRDINIRSRGSGKIYPATPSDVGNCEEQLNLESNRKKPDVTKNSMDDTTVGEGGKEAAIDRRNEE